MRRVKEEIWRVVEEIFVGVPSYRRIGGIEE